MHQLNGVLSGYICEGGCCPEWFRLLGWLCGGFNLCPEKEKCWGWAKRMKKKLFTFSKQCILMLPGRTFIGPMANQQHLTGQLRRLHGRWNLGGFEEAVWHVSFCVSLCLCFLFTSPAQKFGELPSPNTKSKDIKLKSERFLCSWLSFVTT